MSEAKRRAREREEREERRGLGANGNEEENSGDHGCESCSFEDSRVEVTKETDIVRRKQDESAGSGSKRENEREEKRRRIRIDPPNDEGSDARNDVGSVEDVVVG